jgi:NhaP-type Na+/H+ or K+/H+ antiporter
MVELPEIGRVLRQLIAVGALTTWGLITLGAVTILHLNWTLAVLIGAMLVVSGPTIVAPLLRTARPRGRLASALKWEGILIDPIGVLFSVLVFEGILEQEITSATLAILVGVLKMAGVGSLLGWLSARLLVTMFQRYGVPDFLHNAVALTMVIGIFTLANLLHEESGLFAVTVMGMVMANQKAVTIRHSIAVKEVLQGFLRATLFILLAVRLRPSDLALIDLMSLLFLAVLILVVRPAAVALSTRGSDWSWRERAFLAWIAPRGIVAAAVAPIFAHRLGEVGVTQVELLVPLTFLVIAGTVAVYGLTAAPVARWLHVAQANPQGIVCVGASPLARALAHAVHVEGFRVLLVDTNWPHIAAARLEGLLAYYGNALLEETLDDLDLDYLRAGRGVSPVPGRRWCGAGALRRTPLARPLSVCSGADLCPFQHPGSDWGNDQNDTPE